MAVTTEQRSKIESLKREVWAAKVVAEESLADALQKKRDWVKSDEKHVADKMKLDTLRNSLIAALDDLV